MKRSLLYIILPAFYLLSVGCNADGTEKLQGPPPPLDATATPQTGAILLSWSNPTGTFDHIQIEYKKTGGTAFMAKSAYPSTSWKLDNISSTDGEYSFKLRTVNVEGILSEEYASTSATALEPTAGGTLPPMVSDVAVQGAANTIEVSWTLPQQGEYDHVVVEYTDPRTTRKHSVKVEYPKTALILNGVYREDGEFVFKVWTVNSEGNASSGSETVSAKAQQMASGKPVEAAEKLILTADMLSQNAPEPGAPDDDPPKVSESVLEHLIDGVKTTFYMTDWRKRDGSLIGVMPHWVQFDLPKSISDVKLILVTRHNADYAYPLVIEILVGDDGEIWDEIGIIGAGSLPSTTGFTYESEVFNSSRPFSKLRFNVVETLHGYWGLAEIELWEVTYN